VSKLPAVATHHEDPTADILTFTTFPREVLRQVWSNNLDERLTARSAAALTSSGSSPTATPSSGWSGPS